MLRTLLLLLSLAIANLLNGQCIPNPNIIPGHTFDDAMPICCNELDGYTNTLPDFETPTFIEPLCANGGIVNNAHVFSFFVESPQLILEIIPMNCDTVIAPNGDELSGIQAAFTGFFTFLNNEANACVVEVQSETFTIGADNLEIGQQYFLILDGGLGSVCDYTINVLTGSMESGEPVNDSQILPESAEIGECGDVVFSLELGENLALGEWSISPEPTEYDDNFFGVMVVNEWGAAEEYEICHQPTLPCSAESAEEYRVCKTYTINEAVLQNDLQIENNNCLGAGSIVIEPGGGVPPYTIDWEGQYQGFELNNLSAGTYAYTITDDGDCTFNGTAVVYSSSDYDLDITPADCDGLNGSASLQSSLSNAMINWSTGASGNAITNLDFGGYSVTLTDEDNCNYHQNFYVERDPACLSTISGTIYNNYFDPICEILDTVHGLNNIQVELSDGQIAYTNSLGYFQFAVDTGTYTIQIPFLNTDLENICFDELEVQVPAYELELGGNDFFFSKVIPVDVLVNISKPNIRPGFSANYYIYVVNNSPFPASGTVEINYPAELEYIDSDMEPVLVDSAAGKITWDFDNLPAGLNKKIRVKLKVPETTPIGTMYTYSIQVDSDLMDTNLENNFHECIAEVTGAYDPNDKMVDPVGEGAEGYIIKDTTLAYQIRFQNVGNDTAFTVLIRDTLNENLNIESLRPGFASHDYSISIKEGNILEFLFENIFLVDSTTNEPGSNGFVKYTIALKEDLAPGTEITNNAGIYFDFNAPVITNTVLNTIELPNAVDEMTFEIPLSLTPNPTAALSLLQFELTEAATYSIWLYNISGQQKTMLHDQTFYAAGKNSVSIDSEDLASGLYYVVLRSEKAVVGVSKLVKM